MKKRRQKAKTRKVPKGSAKSSVRKRHPTRSRRSTQLRKQKPDDKENAEESPKEIIDRLVAEDAGELTDLWRQIDQHAALFYPACGLNLQPCHSFSSQCDLFVYCDWGISKESFKNAIEEFCRPPSGVKLRLSFYSNVNRHIKSIRPTMNNLPWVIGNPGADLPKSWCAVAKLNRRRRINSKPTWLLYFAANPIEVYRTTFTRKRTAPKVIYLRRPEGVPVDAWREFIAEDGPLLAAVRKNPRRPQHVFNDIGVTRLNRAQRRRDSHLVRRRRNTMNTLPTLRSRGGFATKMGYDFKSEFSTLAEAGDVDAFIVATEDGFSPLGRARQFFSSDLGISEEEIQRLAKWNRFENPRVTLIALSPRRRGGLLRGVILAACETSECYKRFGTPLYGRPSRDFYYNVTYESIAHASLRWGARRLAISHLSASESFHQDIATCNAEALAHFCDEATSPVVDQFAFVGCCIRLEHLEGIERLNAEGERTRHHPISVERENRDEVEFIHLSWPLLTGQVWAISPGEKDETLGLYRIEASERPGAGVTIQEPAPTPPDMLDTAAHPQR